MTTNLSTLTTLAHAADVHPMIRYKAAKAARRLVDVTTAGWLAEEDACMAEPSRPQNGLDRCACGCKYWTPQDRCFDCGDAFGPEGR